MVKVRDAYPLLDDGSIDTTKWLKMVSVNRTLPEIEVISIACALASEHDQHCTNSSGVSCYEQGLTVAGVLNELGLDIDSIVTGLVYAVYRNGKLSFAAIKEQLGGGVVMLVRGLQQIDNIHAHKFLKFDVAVPDQNSLHNLRKMLLSVAEDVRVVLIELAIHLCETRAAVRQPDAIRRKLAVESKEIYAPLANCLGIGQLKWELEDFALRFLEPVAYKNIAKLLDERRMDREKYIEKVILKLNQALKQQEIKAELYGRAKHICSIWRKMQKKEVGYGEIYDVRAIRVVVPEIVDCYATLGVVHAMWQHIPKEFDDYIACQKNNGYQSLHTAVLGPDGKMLEIQIRTTRMHRMAEFGIAAHWRYKENSKIDVGYAKKLEYFREILNWQNELVDDAEAAEALRTELFEDRVYVFTPKGDIVDLPTGATALDFAYHIHTDIGHRCRGAKVNGQIVSLSKPLVSGAQVEVLTTREGGPSRDWLNSHLKYLVTSRAKAKVHQWFKRQDLEQNIQAGRDTIHREFKRLGINKFNLKEMVAVVANCDSEEALLAGLGNGEIKISQLFGALQRLKQSILPQPKLKFQPTKLTTSSQKAEITVESIGDLKCHMARCCNPIPGDEIIGYITIGEGVSVHKRDCINILQVKEAKSNRLIEVAWGKQTKNNYLVAIYVNAYDRRGLLHDISAVMASEHVDVLNMSSFTDEKKQIAHFTIKLEIAGMEMLGTVLSRIQQVPNVIDAYRQRNN